MCQDRVLWHSNFSLYPLRNNSIVFRFIQEYMYFTVKFLKGLEYEHTNFYVSSILGTFYFLFPRVQEKGNENLLSGILSTYYEKSSDIPILTLHIFLTF